MLKLQKTMALHTPWERLMSGHTSAHEQLQEELATFVNKQAAYLLNFGYQVYFQQSILLFPKMMSSFMMLMPMLV